MIGVDARGARPGGEGGRRAAAAGTRSTSTRCAAWCAERLAYYKVPDALGGPRRAAAAQRGGQGREGGRCATRAPTPVRRGVGAMPLDLARARRARAHRARAAGGAERRGRGRRRRCPRSPSGRGRSTSSATARGSRARPARSGVPVFHCTAETRDDGRGANRNARLFLGREEVAGAALAGQRRGAGARRDRRRPGRHRAPPLPRPRPDDRHAARLDAAQPRRHDDRRRRRLAEHRDDELRVRRREPRLPDRDADATRSPASRPTTPHAVLDNTLTLVATLTTTADVARRLDRASDERQM